MNFQLQQMLNRVVVNRPNTLTGKKLDSQESSTNHLEQFSTLIMPRMEA